MCSGWLFFSILSPKNVVDPKICYILEFFFTSGLDLLHQTEPQSHRFHSRIRAFLGHQRYFLERKPNFTKDIKVKKLFKISKTLNFEFSRPFHFLHDMTRYRPLTCGYWLRAAQILCVLYWIHEAKIAAVRYLCYEILIWAPKKSLLRSRQLVLSCNTVFIIVNAVCKLQ